MQPPPQRKGKLVQQLRNVQTEQFTKLQQRYQLQIDLLEDVRSYMKQKCSVEREYAQSLQKLNALYLQKRDYEMEDETALGQRSPLKVWKSYLDESENMAKQRVTVAEKEQTDVVDKIKSVKANKIATFKKCQELFQRIYDELHCSLREMSKCRKAYIELEKLAELAEKETGDAQDKLKKGVTFFKSKATLEKNVSKSAERRDLCVRQVNAGRNEYLLCVASLNGHVKRLKEIDLPFILKELDDDFYEQMSDYNRTSSVLEVEACSYAKAGFDNVVSNAEMISRDKSISYFFDKNDVFQGTPTYVFEPYGEDKVSGIVTDGTVALAIEKETRKLAMKYVREKRLLKKRFKKLDSLESLQNEQIVASPEAQQDPENSVEFLKEAIRKLETIIEKTEASLDLLRSSGLDVDNWIKSAEAQMPVEETALKPVVVTNAKDAGEYVDVYEASPEADTADDTWDEFEDTIYDKEDDELSVSSGHVYNIPQPAVVLYDYTAVSVDELSIAENEDVEVLEKDGEGWCKGRNKDGQVGYFPESYVQISSTPPSTISGANSVPDNLSADIVLATEVSHSNHSILCRARALFDYAGQSDEELSFEEGAIINILRKDDGEVDDGWWKGEFNGVVGVFPSLLVEEEDNDETDGQTEEDGCSTYAVPTNYYNQEQERTGNLYGTLPRTAAEKRQTSGVCENLDLTVPRSSGSGSDCVSGPPPRPQLPQQILRQNLKEKHKYDHNEYV